MASPSTASGAPNVLVVLVDDQSYETWSRDLMPNVFSKLVDQGVEFDRGYVSDGLCCPARAQILTGRYEHDTGIDNLFTRMTGPTVVRALQVKGYRTMLAGKYMNSESCDPRPEFTRWVCSTAPPSSYSQVDPYLNVDGVWIQHTGTATDILADYATDFIASTPADQPFFALYAPSSPHLPADDPACADLPVSQFRPPSYVEDTRTSGKPAYMARQGLSAAESALYDHTHEIMTQAVTCLDRSVGTLLDGLGSRADNTLVFYLSDNGYLYGEHARTGKRVPYEEAVHVPFVVRYPAVVPTTTAFTSAALVSNVDIAPTIAAVAGLDWSADGQSLLPLLAQEETTVRDALLLEGCEGAQYPCLPQTLPLGESNIPSYTGIVTDQYKYLEYLTGEVELYDLAVDHWEMVNLHGQPDAAGIEATLAAELELARAPSAPETGIIDGPSGAITTRVPTVTFAARSFRARFECRVTSNSIAGAWERCDGGTFTPLLALSGTHLIEVRALGDMGDVDATPVSRTVTVTTAGPNVSITSGPTGVTKNKVATFKFKSTSAQVTFECRTGLLAAPGPWAACVSPVTYGNLTDATRTFEVRAVGRAGASTVPATKLWTVDHSGPVITFLDQPFGVERATDERFAFRADDALTGDLTCSVDLSPSAPCTSGLLEVSGLTEGSHTLTVTATNKVALTRSTSVIWVVDRTAPAVTLTGSLADGDVTAVTTVSITPTANEPLDDRRSWACAFDGQILIPGDCAKATITFQDLATGTHTFETQAQDKAFNVSPLSSLTFTVVPPS